MLIRGCMLLLIHEASCCTDLPSSNHRPEWVQFSNWTAISDDQPDLFHGSIVWHWFDLMFFIVQGIIWGLNVPNSVQDRPMAQTGQTTARMTHWACSTTPCVGHIFDFVFSGSCSWRSLAHSVFTIQLGCYTGPTFQERGPSLSQATITIRIIILSPSIMTSSTITQAIGSSKNSIDFLVMQQQI